MKRIYISLILAILTTNGAFAYEDYDIDGVDDSVDLCPNTPFDELVDRNGCSKSQTPSKSKRVGKLTLKVGTNIYRDKDYEDDTSLNLYANYRYKSWDISISNSRSISTSSSYDEDNSYSDNDVYISVGKSFNIKKGIAKISIGTKITGDVDEDKVETYTRQRGAGGLRKYGIESGSQQSNTQNLNQTSNINQTSTIDNTSTTTYEQRDNDYFASINYSYPITNRQNIFLYYGYTLSGDSKSVDYENYSSFSIGTGYMITRNWYSAISYNYTGSIYKDADPTETINWFNSYNFTRYLFATAGYSYALDDISYQNIYSLALGVTF